MLKDLLKASRSYRRFYEDDEIPKELLENWVDNVRYAPSAANAQTLKFKICTGEEERGYFSLDPLGSSLRGLERTGTGGAPQCLCGDRK